MSFDGNGIRMMAPAYEVGLGHPDPEIAFDIECEILEGEAYEVGVGFLRSRCCL